MELNFSSVESIPYLNASAAFQVDSGKVFKEDTDIVPVIVDDTLSYVPWGGDNAMPYNILELIESDETLEQLIGYLFRIEEWWQSATRQWFTATMFPNIDLANLCGYNDHRWSNHLGLRSKAIDLEQRIAEEFVSPEQLAVLREEVFSMSWDFSCEPSAMPNLFEHCQGDAENGRRQFSLTASCHTQIIERLRTVIVSALQGNMLNIQSLRDIVDFMRKHDEQFPEFRSSRTYKLFEPPIFENKKNYHGYFF